MADETVTTVAKRGGIKREDPPPRPVEQTANRGYLEGADPTKHYVWVSEVNDPTINVGYYKHRGYKIAQYDPAEARQVNRVIRRTADVVVDWAAASRSTRYTDTDNIHLTPDGRRHFAQLVVDGIERCAARS